MADGGDSNDSNEDMDRFSAQDLVQQSLLYEFTPTIPFRYWVRTAYAMLMQGQIYDREHEIQRAFVLFNRCADLVLNHLALLPEAKSSEASKAISDLYKSISPLLARMEKLKVECQEQHEQYMVLEKVRLAQLSAERKRQKEFDDLLSYRRIPASAQGENGRRSSDNRLGQIRLEASDSSSDEGEAEHASPDYDFSVAKQIAAEKTEKRPDLLTSPRSKSGSSLEYPQIPELHKPLIPTKKPPLPKLPPKLNSEPSATAPSPATTRNGPKSVNDNIQHPNRYTTEGGAALRTIYLPVSLREKFLAIAQPNTTKKLETCGILCGRLSRNALFITHLVIPDQESTSDTCGTRNEEALFKYQDDRDLLTLGWIHTHPTQTCFMSSVDLHTHNSYQLMLAEAIAIVCAPTKKPDWSIFRLTDPPGIQIITKCRNPASFHPHPEPNIYTTAYKPGHVQIRQDIPFEIADLRPKNR